MKLTNRKDSMKISRGLRSEAKFLSLYELGYAVDTKELLIMTPSGLLPLNNYIDTSKLQTSVDKRLMTADKSIVGSINTIVKVVSALGDIIESNSNSIELIKKTMDDLIINAGNSNSEVVDARTSITGTSYPKLGTRLDSIDTDISKISSTTSKVISINSDPEFSKEDISISINSILKKCNDGDILVLDNGNYKLADTINYSKRVDLILNGSISFIGESEVAISVKDDQSSANGLHKKLVVNKLYTNLPGKIGIEITHCFHGVFNLGYVYGFDVPLNLSPNKYETLKDEGIQYCDFKFLWLQSAPTGKGALVIESGSNRLPWVNENTFKGGRLLGSTGLKIIKGSTQIDPYNNNKFYDIGCEGLTSNGISIEFSAGNVFSNFRFEQVSGNYISESNTCSHNRYLMTQTIKKSKLDIRGNNTYLDFPLYSDSGSILSCESYYNMYDGKDNSTTFNMNIIDRSEIGLAHCNYGDDLYDRFAFVLTDKSGHKYKLPCKELGTAYVDNTDFTLNMLYKDIRILSNTSQVTITIPDKFKYDGAEFNFSTNYNTHDIIFVSESGDEHFRITNSDGLGTWNVLYVSRRGTFSPAKLTESFRKF